MIRIRLPEAEAERLEEAFRSTGDRKHRDRLQIVLPAHRGRKRQDIAAGPCIGRRSVQRWLNAYRERGLAGLVPRRAKGATAKAPASLADEVKRWLIEGPAKQGLGRAGWTYEGLAGHLFKTRGVRTSRSAAHRLCSKLGIRPYRPTYRYLRGDPVKRAEAREELAELKRGRRPASSPC